MKESVRKILMGIMAIGFLAGMVVLIYPLFSNLWNEYVYDIKFQEYQYEVAEKLTDEGLADEWEKAHDYNDELQPIIIPDSFAQSSVNEEREDYTLYMSCLNVDGDGDGIMGYLSIPKIEVTLPIYHTTSEDVLQKGAGHVQGSSLPAGGESTHAAIAAHRGLPTASMFTDLDQLEIGDQFYLYILDDVLAYEVDQILVVEPDDTSALAVEEGQDYVTLITCTPYAINSQRLLVRGHRVEYSAQAESEQAENISHSANTNYAGWILIGMFATGVLMFISGMLIHRLRTRKAGRR